MCSQTARQVWDKNDFTISIILHVILRALARRIRLLMTKKINYGICRRGFTLAEVLITLGIIGVVAALTIPSLVTNIQDNQYKAAWKKTFSAFNQATLSVMDENGGTMLGIGATAGSGGARARTYRDQYAKYLNAPKSCGFGTTIGGCWTPNGVKTLNGAVYPLLQNEAGLILNDGTLIDFGNVNGSNCSNSLGTNQTIRYCGLVFADVNGFKGPNVLGKDIFGLYTLQDRIVPFGVDGDNDENKPSGSCPDDETSFGGSSYAGAGCAAKYLTQ